MELSPAFKQRAGLGGSEISARRQELIIRGHDADERKRHDCADEQSCKSNVPRSRRAAFSRVRVDAAVRGQRSTISFMAMADGSDVNKALVVCDSVNNAPLAYANAP